MPKWLVVLTAGWIVVLAASRWWVKTGTSEIQETGNGSETVEIKDGNPYLIESMRRRSYDSEITTERRVRETQGFVSYVVSFHSDGLTQYALMNVPKGARPAGGWPVVIVNHGYIDPEVYSTENSYINTSAFFANAGFLVVKPDYRGHGESEGEAGTLVARISYGIDVLNLIEGIRKLAGADGNRIYMYGHSMGGDVSLRVVEVCGTCVRAASLWAPAVRDWPESFLYFSRRNLTDARRRERWERMQKQLEEKFTPDEYDDVSAFDNIHLVQVPVNIHHGTNDESVPYEWGERIADRFRQEGKTFEFFSYGGDNHDIAGNWGTALSRDVELFRETI